MRPVEVTTAGVVADLERGGADDRRTGRLQKHGAPRSAMGLGDVGQLAGNGAVQQFFVGEDGLEFLDLPLQIVTFALELDA